MSDGTSDGTSDGMSKYMTNGMVSERCKSDTTQTCQIFAAHLRDTKIMSETESSKISQTAMDEWRVTHTSEKVEMNAWNDMRFKNLIIKKKWK